MKIKPLVNSLTVQIALADFLINCTYTIEDALNSGGMTSNHVLTIVRHLLFASGLIYGRSRASSVLYSPKHIPGYNKEQAESLARN
ncbi:hypothetical protein NG799_01885 [Laspinema sp. D1]|uniref:Uncharacterized protein n=2 Tax=Laspinema TaxID=2584823 RepID=A0ABT2MK14_9CYAN|nr:MULTISPECIES: hypothetical protein [unclassified Laspinema]MCT7965082.1 hypothetical protein [Laspinema sp. D2a]MCT7977631.1 hypothetical protein [Laspinema sp. D3b]MCT7992476.1 hypothetical protein [Laspinema sp. D3c]